MSVRNTETKLKDLDFAYVTGHQALKDRTELILEMVGSGFKQADVYRLLNDARAEVGGKPLTRDAVFMLVYRNRNK